MSHIDELIESSEKRLAKIEAQYHQEKAMKEVLPIRFEKNMAFFKENLPKIYHQFIQYKPQRQFEFFCTDNGIPNLRLLDSKEVLYTDDPYAEAQLQLDSVFSSAPIIKYNLNAEYDPFYQQHMIYLNKLVAKRNELTQHYNVEDQINESIPLCMVFGVGLGYHFSYLYERVTPANIYIFEPDTDLFYASLFAYDWFDILSYILANNLGVHFFLGQEPDDIILDLRAAQTFNAPFISSVSFGYIHYFSEKIKSLQERLSKEFYLLSMGWGFFDDNLFSLSHSVNNIKSGVHFLKNNYKISSEIAETPVFVIANGPSLDQCIDLIRKNQDKFIIVACGTAITALYKANIKPDIYVAVERVSVVAESLYTIPDKTFFQDMLIIGPDVLHPTCRNYFSKMVYAFKADEPLYAMLATNTDINSQFKRVAYINPLVGNAGLSFPLHIGFKNIYLCGADNGYKDPDHHHSKLSMYYEDDGNTKNDFKGMSSTQGKIVIPANFGGDVFTNSLFHACVMMMEVAISHFPKAKCHNCSDGAYIKGTISQDIHQINFDSFNQIDKKLIVDYLYQEASKPVDIDPSVFDELMDYEFFEYLMSKIKDEWVSLPNNRLAIVQMMQTQMEYLTQISKSKQAHIWNVCFGSFSTIFSFMTGVLYSIPDEEKSIQATHEMLPILLEFFDKMNILYKNGLNMIQGQHLKI